MDVVEHVKAWLEKVVIANNFCPFAARPFLNEAIDYCVVENASSEALITSILSQANKMQADKNVETVLVISPDGPEDFIEYLKWYDRAVEAMHEQSFEGVFQLASFHPDYQFADAPSDDASNYTNRSPYPIFHILREDSVSKAVELHPNVHSVPQHNIEFCRERGIDWLREQLASLQ